MKLIDQLINFFNGSNTNKTPAGVCPNCWGRQEYAGKYKELYKDQQIDVNNHQANYSFIQKFVINNIKGITLKEGETVCPSCSN